ncbi:MAG: VOC family protein [bacterium]|nr:VOC family protein [bacterium]
MRLAIPLLAALSALTSGGCVSSEASPEVLHQHHTIDYIEFTVRDLPEAKRFYTEAFGWSFTDYGPEYAGIQRPGGGEVGGMHQAAELRIGGPLVVLYSSDLEASVQAVVAAGGEIVKEPFGFPGGRRFHFLDPSGNELAVWGEAQGAGAGE